MQSRLAAVGLLLASLGLLGAPGRALSQATEPPEDPVIAEGNPPLCQSDVDAWRHLVEFAFDATLTDEQAALLQGQLVSRWNASDAIARTEVLQARPAWQRLGGETGAQKQLMRLAFREQLLDAAKRDADDPASRLVLALHQAQSPLIVEGEMPLRKGSLDALVALFEWLGTQATGQPAELTELERQEFAGQIARHYPRAAPGDQMLLTHMEETLTWLQAEWEKAGPQGQRHFRDNLARVFGIQRPLLPAPFTGATDTWEHPDGMFTVQYPADWPARYAVLPEGTSVAGWGLFDLSILGDAPTDVLELKALPAAGALIAVAALPADALADRITIDEAVFALAAELLSRFGTAEPLGDSTSGQGAVLTAWRQMTDGQEYAIFLSAILLPEPQGAAVITLTRAPSADAAEFEPAFSRIIYSLTPRGSSEPSLTDLLNLPEGSSLARTLLNTPLREQMDLIEDLTSGMR